MNDSAQFENALDRLTSALKDVFRELHVPAPAPPPAAVVEPPPPPPPPAPVIPTGPGTDFLCEGFDRILAAGNQIDIMQALLDTASSYAARCAILVVKGDKLAPWRWNGFEESQQAGWRKLDIAADGDNGWRQAIGLTGPLPQSVSKAFFGFVGSAKSGRAYLVPLIVRERPVAMMFSDGGASGLMEESPLRLLARTAGIRLETMSGGATRPAAPAPAPVSVAVAPPTPAPAPVVVPPPVAAAPPPAPAPPPPSAPLPPVAHVEAAPVLPTPPASEPAPPLPAPAPSPVAPPLRKSTGPDLSAIAPEDQEAHKKAFRFAKLLVDELMLYNKDKVAQGKKQHDVYALLQEDIDKSRLAYEKKFASTPAAKVDYFHQQMVAQIGEGDPAAIGPGYPGPLV
jgi:hypothetical protein